MKAYRLKIKTIVVVVGIASLLFFSAVFYYFRYANFHNLEETLLNYGYIIAPVTLLWLWLDLYAWHTRLFQSFRKSVNIPPDLRGRWEGTLENADGSPPQKFVIEVSQTLTSLKVNSYSSISESVSILCEMASDVHEEHFTLCYLWEGQINPSIQDVHQGERFQGYTMLDLQEHEHPKLLRGSYFTNRKSGQTRGGIQMQWTSRKLLKKLE